MTTSLWQDAAGPPWEPLRADARADVAIVGAGIAGLSLALVLARDGARVVVLEAGRIGAGASGRNAGFVLAGVAENFVAACRRYGGERAARLWRFTLTNRTLLRALIQRHGIECESRWNGSLQIAGSEAEWAEIRESVALLGPHRVRGSLVEAERGALFPNDGELHPVRLLHGLAAAAAGLGAQVQEASRATAVAADHVVTDAGTVRAGAGCSTVRCTPTAATATGGRPRTVAWSSGAGAPSPSRRSPGTTTGRPRRSRAPSTPSCASGASQRP